MKNRNKAKTVKINPVYQARFIRNGILLLMMMLFSPVCFSQAFDHDNTLFPLDLKHGQVSCDSCHINQIFKGTPTQCYQCHSKTGRIQASSPSANHISTTNECEFCHQSPVWDQVIRVDHYAVNGPCQLCHNGTIAEGKNPGHIESSEVCDNCHQTNSWLNAVFDHSDINGNCITCHNGLRATGKNPAHILTGDNCDDCHNTLSFSPVISVDHLSVIGSCSSCHNGVIATGKDADHEITTDECNACHTTVNWTVP